MKPTKQAQLIKQMSDHEVTLQLIFTQIVILFAAIIGSLFLFDTFIDQWVSLFNVTLGQWFWFGILPGILVLLIDFIMIYYLPKRLYSDGGINEKVFQSRSLVSIIGIILLVSFSEELLFRGVLHTEFGYVIASLLFAVIHIRYLTKIVLFVSVFLVSFLIGYMFEMTGSLTVTITAHFLINVVLALWIRYKE